jgi:hypothetical protein
MKNLNADFLLDIWADLKAKRLAPVAVGLVAMVVVMPALMLKGEETPGSAGPLPITPTPAADTAQVELDEELAEDSKLDSYKAHDPFDGLVKPQGDDPTSGTAIAPSDAAAEEASKELEKLMGGGIGGSAPASDPSDSPDLGGSGGGGGGLTTGGNPEPPTIIRRPGARYTYTLDVKFGRPGREKRYNDLARMSFLPSPDVPVLLFMGVPVDAKSALFFVYPGLSHAGEGVCIPSKANCNFLQLAIGREHFLSIDDYEFHLQLLDINKVKLSAERKRDAARKTMGTRRSGRGIGDTPLAEDAETDERPLPWLVDGIG